MSFGLSTAALITVFLFNTNVKPYSLIGCLRGIVSFLFLGGAYSNLCSSGWVSSLAIAAGRLAGAGRVDRANRVCVACNSDVIANEQHVCSSVQRWLL